MTALYLGIDFGTSGCRACVIDCRRKERAAAATALPPAENDGAAREQDPEIWWQALTDTIGQIVRQVPAAAIQAIAVDGTSGTLLLADHAGRPLVPALLYHDARSQLEAQRIAAHAPRENPVCSPTSSLAKLLYLQASIAPTRAHHALHQTDWINGRLTGRFGVTDHNNALKLGYDRQNHAWPAWIGKLGVGHDILPEVRAPGALYGPLGGAAATHFGLPAGTPVFCGTTDSTAACLAAGVERPGDAVTSLGTTLVTKVLCAHPVTDARFGVYSQPFGAWWLVGGASNSGGAALRRYFDLDDIKRLSPLIPGDRSSGLDYYPLPGVGERFPLADATMRSRTDPRPDNPIAFLHGLLEGIARIEQRAYRCLADLGAPYPASVRSLGGGAGNPAWTRIRAGLLQLPMPPPVHRQAAYGAALLALRGHQTMRPSRICK